MRTKNKQEIDELQSELDVFVKKMEKYETKHTNLEESIQKKIEEFENEREKNIEITKRVK
jgi:DNA repair exonuclease SbcCD ATPase subunit